MGESLQTKCLICEHSDCLAKTTADVSLKGSERRSNQPRNSIRPGLRSSTGPWLSTKHVKCQAPSPRASFHNTTRETMLMWKETYCLVAQSRYTDTKGVCVFVYTCLCVYPVSFYTPRMRVYWGGCRMADKWPWGAGFFPGTESHPGRPNINDVLDIHEVQLSKGRAVVQKWKHISWKLSFAYRERLCVKK